MSNNSSKKRLTVAGATSVHGVGATHALADVYAAEKYVEEANLDLLDTVAEIVGDTLGKTSQEVLDLGIVERVDTTGMTQQQLGLYAPVGDEGPGQVARPLFLRGTDALVLAKTITRSNSPQCNDFEEGWFAKVGDQGNRFSMSYVARNFLKPYLLTTEYVENQQFVRDVELAYKQPDLAPRYALALKSVAKRWISMLSDGGKLVPLTFEEAIEIVCGKNTAAFPFGGVKNSAEVREFCYERVKNDDWDDFEPSALVGQRYQRNKKFYYGSPKIRCVFNADVLSAVRATRWITPVIRKLQALSHDDSFLTGQHELKGLESVGRAMASFVMSCGSARQFVSASFDVSAMDTCMTAAHMQFFTRFVLKEAFELSEDEMRKRDDYYELYLALNRTFRATLYLPGGVKINCKEGLELSLLSGIVPTHVPESFWSQCASELILGFAAFRDPAGGGHLTLKTHGYMLETCGDDQVILSFLPWHYFQDGITDAVYDVKTKESLGMNLSQFVCHQFELIGFKAAAEKQVYGNNGAEFCSHFFSKKNAILEDVVGDDGKKRAVFKAFRPTYSIVATINAIKNPEDSLPDKSLSSELQRCAMICDGAYGHESYNALITAMVNSLADADKEGLRDLFAVGLDNFKISRHLVENTWNTFGTNWSAQSSPTMRELYTKIMGENPTLDTPTDVARDVRLMRALHWRYRINPSAVVNSLAPVGNEEIDVSPSRYCYFFDDEDPTAALKELEAALYLDRFGNCVSLRDMAHYNHSQTWLYNFDRDNPLENQNSKNASKKASKRDLSAESDY